MYLRTTKRHNKDGSTVEYYQLAETRWDPIQRRPTAHIIHNFGRADTLDRDALLRLAQSISRVCQGGLDVPPEVSPPGEALDIEWALTLDHLYFALDFLDTHIEAIEREIFFRIADLFRADVDLIFWDTTSVYFEVDDEDTECETKRDTTLPPLRQRGYNKEGRGNQPQIVVGLALTRDGLPVRSWGFPGNTVDATTVAQVKESLRGWKLGRAIFVGDAGMDSEANRHELAQGLGHYILAMPMGKLTEVQAEVLARAGRVRAGNPSPGGKGGVVGEGGRRQPHIVC